MEVQIPILGAAPASSAVESSNLGHRFLHGGIENRSELIPEAPGYRAAMQLAGRRESEAVLDEGIFRKG